MAKLDDICSRLQGSNKNGDMTDTLEGNNDGSSTEAQKENTESNNKENSTANENDEPNMPKQTSCNQENSNAVATKSEVAETCETGGGRKNKRKSRKPVNINRYPKEASQIDYILEDDLEEYRPEEYRVSGATDILDENENIAELSTSSKQCQVSSITEYANSSQFDDLDRDLIDDSYNMDSSGALDLSVSKPETDEQAAQSACADSKVSPKFINIEPEDPTFNSVGQNDGVNGWENHDGKIPNHEHPPKEKPEGGELVNYAESTMHELLSMYGFAGAEAEAQAKKGARIATLNPALVAQHIATTAYQAASNGDLTKEKTAVINSTPTTSAPKKESSFSKLAESVSKLPNLPSDQLIGNPPVLLPHMANAALRTSMLHALVQRRREAAPVLPPAETDEVPAQASPNNLVNDRLAGTSKNALDKFTTSADYIKACFSPGGGRKTNTVAGSGGKMLLPDYAKYLKRFESHEECFNQHCKDMSYREHFHCMDCNYRVFVKKEEMIRHFKWHRKRDDSLQHGFMRYSPMDDCTVKFGDCTHNGRQTHYHCLQAGCNKVYISTSDVQMHANYHRKDSAIIQEGFQRFRATEDCGTPTCSFYGQRTTHFHCRRSGCTFTFKNKADMEKHKTYHQKDELLARDGFKKFMKYEHCTYSGCRYSKVANHIHCIRPGCNYVLHSTGQLYSHKRKHERRDYENAYKRFRADKPPVEGVSPSSSLHASAMMDTSISTAPSTPGSVTATGSQAEYVDLEDLSLFSTSSNHSSDAGMVNVEHKPDMSELATQAHPSTLAKLASKLTGQGLNDSLSLPIPASEAGETSDSASSVSDTAPLAVSSPIKAEPGLVAATSGTSGSRPGYVPAIMEKPERDESWKKHLTRYTANDPCHSRCQFLYKDHYHCTAANCGQLFRSKDGVREHAKYHDQQDKVTEVWFVTGKEGEDCDRDNCTFSKKQTHYHCLWSGCSTIVLEKASPFARLEHHRIHEFSRTMALRGNNKFSLSRLAESKRRRGRPPKYPKELIPSVPKDELEPDEVEEEIEHLRASNPVAADILETHGFRTYPQGEPCPDEKCMFNGREHYHCVRPRCYHACDRTDVLKLHSHDFHNFITILEGFEFFDRSVNCRRPHCQNNHSNRHFHCVRPRCDYAFVRYSTMHQHDKKHKQVEEGLASYVPPVTQIPVHGPLILPKTAQKQPVKQGASEVSPSTVKAKGTFYPLSTIPKVEVAQSAASPGVPVLGMRAAPMSTSHIIISSPTGPLVAQLPVTSVLPMVQAPMGVSVALVPTQVAAPVAVSQANPSNSGLLPLLQVKGTAVPQVRWSDLAAKMHYGIDQNCGRPFCKLKKKEHFHCYECNQAMSESDRLKAHMSAKHGLRVDQAENVQSNPVSMPNTILTQSQDQTYQVTDKKTGEDETANEAEEEEIVYEEGEVAEGSSSSLNLRAGAFTAIMNKSQVEQLGSPASGNYLDAEKSGNTSPSGSDDEPLANLSLRSEDDSLQYTPNTTDDGSRDRDGAGSPSESEETSNGRASRRSNRKRTATKHTDFIDSDQAVAKQRRISGSKSSKDENVPEGYEKFKYYDDCKVEKCSYRLNASHYHCARKECGYGFSDRLRILTHNQKHERMDSVMGDDFQQFRVNHPCGRSDCEHSAKFSHFHCLRCPFICTDASKVLAHRRQHNKIDNIAAQGFEKFTGTEDCGIVSCNYYKKQTHYHCTHPECHIAVLGPSQMGVHRQKHLASQILVLPKPNTV